MTVLFVLAALLLLGIMVMIHECGHFFAARITGIPVRQFGIGFGPKLKEWKSKKYETTFVLRLIPAGGYCAFYGEDETDGKSKDDPRNFTKAAVWKRMLTIFMGPMMNFVLALLVAICFYAIMGEQTGGDYGRAQIVSVTAGSPAQVAGLQNGDLIETINGKDVSGLDEEGNHKAFAAIAGYQEGEKALEVSVRRGQDNVLVELTPKYDTETEKMLIGVTMQVEYQAIYTPCSIWQAIKLGSSYCYQAGTAILTALKNLVTTGEGIEDTGGPVRIIQIITEETQSQGFTAYISLLIMISVNLGLVNLLPIPGLDGSRIVFLLIEAIRRKPVPQKLEAYVHLGGYLVLILLFIVLTYRDIINLF